MLSSAGVAEAVVINGVGEGPSSASADGAVNKQDTMISEGKRRSRSEVRLERLRQAAAQSGFFSQYQAGLANAGRDRFQPLGEVEPRD